MVFGSRLTQARGLKQQQRRAVVQAIHVAPHAGAWIETTALRLGRTLGGRRASRRRVD